MTFTKICEDLFCTKQPDGTLKVDPTNPAFMYLPVITTLASYTTMGIWGGAHGMLTDTIQHPFDIGNYLWNFGKGFGALSILGGGATWLHSKAIN